MEPQKLGPYELDKRLGRGGMGAVYEARHELTGETVAVKILAAHLTDDPGLRQRFEAEVETLKPLRSSGIVQLLAFGEQDGQPYFAMELVRGKSLSEHLKTNGPFPWRQTIALAIDIVRSLKVAHDHGIIHRDLKPANLLLVDDPRSAGTTIKLADFGIARLFGSVGHTAHGSIVGTAEFMAPEQASGKLLDARADLYSLGLVMFAMLAGKPPFRGAQLTEIITRQIHEKPPPISNLCPDVPSDLASLIEQLLEKAPANRPASALAVGRRLSAILNAADAVEQDNLISEKQGTALPVEPQVLIRPQSSPSTPTDHSGRSAKTHSPISRGINLEAPTRDAPNLDGTQATDETVDLSCHNMADTTDHPAGVLADSSGGALTTDFLKRENNAGKPTRGQHQTTVRKTGQEAAGPAASDTSRSSADTVVDELRGSRFVTMAEIDRVNEKVVARRRFRQNRLQVLITVLITGMAGIIAYLVLRPPTADQLYERISAVAHSNDGDLRDIARDMEDFLSGFPDDSRVSEIAALELRRKVDLLEKRSRRRILGNRMVSAFERDYRAAMTNANDSPSAAVAALLALETLHRDPEAGLSAKDHAVWMALVKRQIKNLEMRAEAEQQEDRRRAEEILDEVARLGDQTQQASAEQTASSRSRQRLLLSSLIATYGDRPHMADVVEAARSQLASRNLKSQSGP